MRIKILLLGDNPSSVMPDRQLLKDRGMLVFTSFNLDNIDALTEEIKPDLVFFDAQNNASNQVNGAYNKFVNDLRYTNIPVVFTLAEDDLYLVTRRRTEAKNKRTVIANNVISAIKMAFDVSRPHPDKKSHKIHYPSIAMPSYNNRA